MNLKQRYIDNPVRVYVPHLERFIAIGGDINYKDEVIPKAEKSDYEDLYKWNPSFFEPVKAENGTIRRRKESSTESDKGSGEDK